MKARQHSRIATGLLALVLLVGQVTAQSLKPEDFAYGMSLAVDGSSALYRALLPFEVYRQTQQADFADLRVFNGSGEAVPYTVQPLTSRAVLEKNTWRLPYFPLYSESGALPEGLSLRVKTSTTGTILELDSQPQASNDAARQLSAYLIDASAQKEPLQALQLDWQSSTESYSAAVTLAVSDDLVRWRTLVTKAPLAALRFQGQVLEQRRIEFAASKAKYLRLSWPEQQPPPQITAIEATSAVRTQQITRDELTRVDVSAGIEQPVGVYDFDLGARLPVDRLQVSLPQQNTLVKARWLSRNTIDESWQQVTSTVLYRLHTAGGELRNPTLSITARKHRYWRLQVNQAGGGLGSGKPQLQAAWIPDQLIFIARGDGPFTLAYGAAGVARAGLPIDGLLPGYRDGGELDAKLITLAEPRTLGGEEKLQLPVVWPWKTYTLWAVLVIAVVLLGWMASRLLRQVNTETTGS